MKNFIFYFKDSEARSPGEWRSLGRVQDTQNDKFQTAFTIFKLTA